MIKNRIDNHQYDELMDYLYENYSKITVPELNDIIEWGNENPREFKGKQAKYREMLRIVERKCEAARTIGF